MTNRKDTEYALIECDIFLRAHLEYLQDLLEYLLDNKEPMPRERALLQAMIDDVRSSIKFTQKYL